MALPSSKSSSSSTVSGRTSPSSRNSEIGNPFRRSFSGNPFSKPSVIANTRSFNPVTPVSSPADHPRRNSISKESLLVSRDYEEKENGKDQILKPARIRSPTVAKSTKNFMSPTISATSKIAVSPKKKILVDRNEPVRTSLSFSDFKSSSLNSVNPNPESVTDLNSEIGPSFDSAIGTPPPKTSKTVRFADVEVIYCSNDDDSESRAETEFIEESDGVNLDPSFKISPISSPIIAPLDADPIMPPYDPKTNYLSPRPQFLHYRPNPRIERYLSKDPDDNRLEDRFLFGSFSESELTEETESENSQRESDEASSTELEKEDEEEEMEEEEELPVSEQISITTISEEKTEVKMPSKPQIPKRNKIRALVLLLFIAGLSIFAVHVYDSNIVERSSLLAMDDPWQIYEFARMNYDGFVERFKVWHDNLLPLIWNSVFNTSGAQPLNYFNLSEFYKDLNLNGHCLVLDQTKGWEEDNKLNLMKLIEEEREVGAELVEREEQMESMEEEREVDYGTVERECQNEEAHQQIDIEGTQEILEESEENYEPSADFESLQTETEESGKGQTGDEEIINEQEINTEFHHPTSDSAEIQAIRGEAEENFEPSADFDSLQTEPEESGKGQTGDEEIINKQEINTEFQHPSPPTSDSSEIQPDVEETAYISELEPEEIDTESRNSTQNLAVISGLMTLLLPLILVYAKRSAGSKPSTTAAKVPQPLLKSHRPPETAEEMAGESCSSEMSSFQYSIRGGAKWLNEEEGHSHSHGGKKTRNNHSRRESLASSSMEEYSASYGSFTTYERIPIKNGNREEEAAVTPVRRSSRIRKQVTSP